MQNERVNLSADESAPGVCYLVGAGPGDPGLITVRGVACLAQAEVVYYDNLAAPVFLDHAPDTAEKIYVGKKAGSHFISQETLCAQLCEAVRAGKIVVRLKGGDPFLFGRGGEEALALAAAGLPYEIIPGVTAAIAGAAYAGIPITHRGIATTATFIAGHEDPDKTASQVYWEHLANGAQTLCFYMGTANLAKICARLIAAGRVANDPVAVIQWATTSHQRTVTGTLASIAEKVAAVKLQPPTMILIGNVVALHEELAWFENRPLYGKRVIVTQARQQAAAQCEALRSRGALPLAIPLLEMRATACAYPENFLTELRVKSTAAQKMLAACDPLTAALGGLHVDESSVWVIFTSTNGVRFVWERLEQLHLDSRVFGQCRIAVVGEKTAAALSAHGITADLIPNDFSADALGDALLDALTTRQQKTRVTLFRSAIADPGLPRKLADRAAGITHVRDIATYENHPITDYPPDTHETLISGNIAAITFASASAVNHFYALFSEAIVTAIKNNPPPAFISIGPATSAALRAHNLPVAKEAALHTIIGLVQAVEKYLRS